MLQWHDCAKLKRKKERLALGANVYTREIGQGNALTSGVFSSKAFVFFLFTHFT